MESFVPVSIDKAKCVLVLGSIPALLPSRPTDRLNELKEKNLETLQLDKTVDSVVAKYPNLDAVDVDLNQVIQEINVNYLAVVSLSPCSVRSFSTSLRQQLARTNVKVMEIIPPNTHPNIFAEQGTTERLSKFWMPDAHIAAGMAETVYKRFEALDQPFPTK
ncbi:hypothetical protein FB451DRAFT_1220043 [Mycena latifolia]|nr:hypothetical protein FB451DRAFT_1220043 [Mycena latifolia]